LRLGNAFAISHFGEDQVFIVIDKIARGEDFIEATKRKISACHITIVSIGPDWLAVTDALAERVSLNPELSLGNWSSATKYTTELFDL
jgi:hypothetical protein